MTLRRRLAGRVLPMLGALLRSTPARRALQRIPAVTVLTYHEVSDAPVAELPPGLVVSADRFRRELEWITRHFEVLSLEQAVGRLRAGRLRSHAIVLTFDDGYRGVATHVYPLLAAMKVPATLFINSSFLRGLDVALRVKLEKLLRHYRFEDLVKWIPGPRNHVQFVALARQRLPLDVRARIDELFQRASAVSFEDPYLHTKDLESMSPDLVTVGNHTRSHRWLAGLSGQEQADEIEGGHRDLEPLPHFRSHFAIPFGTPDSYDDVTLEIAARRYGGMVLTSYGGVNLGSGGCEGLVRNVLRNSVNEGKKPLQELLWSNHLLSFVSRT